jgi:integrase
MAVRAGLRRGELVALQRGDIQLGGNDNDSERFILVQHNYVRREHTTTKEKSRRVDLSRELRKVLVELRDKRLLEAYLKGTNDIPDEFVFRSPEGTILDPDNLYHRVFLPVLAKAGIRKPSRKGKPYQPGEFDFLAVYVITEDVWYIIPARLVLHGDSSGIRIYTSDPTSKYAPYKEAWNLLC